ncbi:tetratricopeptide repeat protein [Candidatus Peregrinibacteria bacterium]|nr:tetratricopeptide repeat protein [Candidatus Peregrinibacteria bacterium]
MRLFSDRQKLHSFLLIGTIVLLGAFLYLPSIGNQFVSWDDEMLIYGNPWLRALNISTITHIFTHFDPELYDPLTLFAWQAIVAVAGFQPVAFHLASLLLFLGSTVLVFVITERLTKNRTTAVIVTLLWALHPLNAAAVLWASAFKDVLSSFFFLSSLLTYLYFRGSGARSTYVFSILLFLPGLLSKVSVVFLPLILILIDLLQKRRLTRGAIVEKIPYVLLSILFLIIAFFGKGQTIASLTAAETMALSLRAILFSALHIVWPWPLAIIYPVTTPVHLVSLPTALSGLAGVAFLLIAILLRRRVPWLSFGLLWFLILLVPSFATFLKGTGVTLTSDQYLMLPMIGILLPLAVALTRLAQRRRAIAIVCMLIVLLPLSLVTASRGRVWRDSISLYRDTIAHFPDVIAMHYNLGLAYSHVRDFPMALSEFDRVLALDPAHAAAHTDKGYVFQLQGKKEDAMKEFRTAIALDARSSEAHNNIGTLFFDAYQYDKAIAEFEAAVAINPRYVQAWNNLAAAYGKVGKHREGLMAMRSAFLLDPSKTAQVKQIDETLAAQQQK